MRTVNKLRFIGMAAVLSCSGCTAFIARQIERPGHDAPAGVGKLLRKAHFQREDVHTASGVRIAYWYGLPHAYHFSNVVSEQRAGSSINVHLKANIDIPEPAAVLPKRGSVLLLHGWGEDGASLAPWGLSFAQAGYVVVMPDLRSQGDSSNAPVGYGPREAGDMLDLVRQLRRAGRLPSPLYLFGESYGATVALFMAPQLRGVRGVMALEPYANAAAVIRRAPYLFAGSWWARWISAQDVNKAIAKAGHRLGIDLDEIDAGNVVAAAPACTLIIHGADDKLTAAAALRALSARSRWVRYVSVGGEGHVSLPLRTDRLATPLLGWMQRLPVAVDGASICPAISPLPRHPARTGIRK